MVRSRSWAGLLARYRWIDRYQSGSDFERFVASEEKRARGVLAQFGVGQAPAAGSGTVPARVSVGRVRGAAGVGRRLVADVAAPARRTAARPRARGLSLRPLAWIGAGLAVNVLAVEWLGIVLSSALLFWTAARAFDRTRPWRDAACAAAGRVGGVPAVRPRARPAAAGRPSVGRAVTGIADTLRALAAGFGNALTVPHLAWALVGTVVGTAIGVLPGIGPALTVAVLLPVTFNVEPTSAFIMFGGIYYGAMYGGSTTSILLNTPGETGSIATAIDGHAMARQGRAAAALATAAIGSFVAGTLATLGLTFLAPPLAAAALRFGPAEYFALAARGVCGLVVAARRIAVARRAQPVAWAWRSDWWASTSCRARRASRSASRSCSTASTW